MIEPPLGVGDMVIYGLRLYRVVEVDRYGFCTLQDQEGETIIRHQSDREFTDTFLRGWACCFQDERSER